MEAWQGNDYQQKIGGQKGVTARMEKVSPERRREIAQKAIAARWAKRGASLIHGKPA